MKVTVGDECPLSLKGRMQGTLNPLEGRKRRGLGEGTKGIKVTLRRRVGCGRRTPS